MKRPEREKDHCSSSRAEDPICRKGSVLEYRKKTKAFEGQV
jgi:hypothetical protein